MNNDNEDYETRLARIELLVESNAKAIAANSAGIAENRQSIAATNQSINDLAEAAGRTLAGIERLRDIVDDNRADYEDYKIRNDATIASINAAVERLDAILNQLLRNRGDNG